MLNKIISIFFPTSYKKSEIFTFFCVLPITGYAIYIYPNTAIAYSLVVLFFLNVIVSIVNYKDKKVSMPLLVGYVSIIVSGIFCYFYERSFKFLIGFTIALAFFAFVSRLERDDEEQ